MEDYRGRIVYSRQGRDRGRAMVVLEVINEQYVMVADGELRRVENPKLKNIRHLKLTAQTDEEIRAELLQGKLPGNHIIRKNLKQLNLREVAPGKEVW